MPKAGTTNPMVKEPKRLRRSSVATALVKEFLLLGFAIEDIAPKVALPEAALRRLYRPEIEAAGAAGQKSHIPTAKSLEQARTCGGIGLSDSDIRRVLGVSHRVFEDSYQEAVEDGRAQGKLTVARELFRKASKQSDSMPNVTAAIYWSKVHMKWVEAEKLEISGPDGAPIQTQTAIVIIPANGRDKLNNNDSGPPQIEHGS